LKTHSLIFVMLFGALVTSACRQDMQEQPKYKPLAPSKFFADGRSARPIPAHTIARDELNDNDSFHTGEINGAFLDTIPLPVNLQLLQRGHDRYNIFCSPCHGEVGDGLGMVARRGFQIPANLHTDRLRAVPPGYIYQVITNGYGAMPDHGDQIPVRDRWAIVAFVRALQLSHHATLADVPPPERQQLEKTPQPTPGDDK
jgi:mono/diheme cytochrome c family protein